MAYSVKEMFYTLQGEGAQAGTPALFVRFAGCNLWSGLEKDRSTAICQFCDTEFVGTDGQNGGKFSTAGDLAKAALALLPKNVPPGLMVCTGGEPLLQLDAAAIVALKQAGFRVAVESNGTLPAPAGLDWLCISPKAGADLVQIRGDELKLVFPQADLPPDGFEHLDFKHLFLQPMDGPEREANTRQAIAYCQAHPHWRLSLQTHKYLGID